MYFFSLESIYFDPLLRYFTGGWIVLILAFAGFAYLPLRAETYLLIGFALAQVLLLLIFWPELRFLTPLFPFLIPVAGGIIASYGGLPAKNVQTAIAAFGIVLCIVCSVIPMRGTAGAEAWYTNASSALFDRGEFDAALAMANGAVRINPAYESGWVNLGAALFASGQAVPARQAWLKALELRKDDTIALRNLALSYEKENPSLALMYWGRCLDAAKSNGLPAASLRAIEEQIARLKSTGTNK
jgi:tetratricopeptide (TPR) repeat protein